MNGVRGHDRPGAVSTWRQVPDRRPGCGKGKIWIADDFDDPLPNELFRSVQVETD